MKNYELIFQYFFLLQSILGRLSSPSAAGDRPDSGQLLRLSSGRGPSIGCVSLNKERKEMEMLKAII